MAQIRRPDLPDQIAQAIGRALCDAPARVQRLDTPLGRLWLKRVERLSLKWVLRKGKPLRSFERERSGLHLLGQAGLPVAPIIAEGSDFFVTPDLGCSLRALMADPVVSADERQAAFEATGRALAIFHLAGFSHGRPAVCDLCWDGTEVRFIDMERFSPRKQHPRHQAIDVLILLHSIFAAGGEAADARAVVTSYRASANPDAWPGVKRLDRRLAPLGSLATWVSARKPRSRDLAAVPRTLAFVASAD